MARQYHQCTQCKKLHYSPVVVYNEQNRIKKDLPKLDFCSWGCWYNYSKSKRKGE